MIPYGKQDINQSDIESVVDTLCSDFLTQGPRVPLFEQTLADYCSANYAVALNSATSALHVACLSLGLSKGDWLWTSPNSFVASANCGVYCGAKVDFVDIDPKTYNLSVTALEKKLIQAEKRGVLPKVVIPVHFAGQSCNMRKIRELGKKYNFKIIEDASHAIGGRYLDRPIGSCQYSDITVFSFHPVKIITTAEGGLATTNDKQLSKQMKLFRSHGIVRETRPEDESQREGWYYQQVDLGFNYRMTELQAALGISQMSKLDKFVTKRHVLQRRYDKLLHDLPIIKPYQSPDSYSALHLYPIQIDTGAIGKTRQQVYAELLKRGIGVNVHYIPIHTHPYYQQYGFRQGDFPEAEGYYSKSISIPLFHLMTFAQQDLVVKALREVL